MTPSDQPQIIIISCQVFEHLIEKYIPPNNAIREIAFLDYGLHVVPRNLKSAIQGKINQVEIPSVIILGYGLCGNGLDGIQSGPHTLVIPRTDDCIGILLGSYENYQREFQENPATYYLTKGWLETVSNPLSQHREYAARYDSETAEYLMDTQYKHYRRLAFVAHNWDELVAYRPQAGEVARYCERWGMRYEEIMGNETYIQKLVEVALALEAADSEFIVVPPGGTLKQNHFMRG